MTRTTAKFAVGQLINHQLFGYRGVIFDADPIFMGSEQWYEEVARSRPPKDEPWYHVLVNDATHTTYVAERNLQPDNSREMINHPLVDTYFASFDDDHYLPKQVNS